MTDLEKFLEEAEILMQVADLDLLEKSDDSSKVAIRIAVELVKLRRSYVGLVNMNMHLILRQQVLETILQLDSKVVDEMVQAMAKEVDAISSFNERRTLRGLNERLTPDLQEVSPVRQPEPESGTGDKPIA